MALRVQPVHSEFRRSPLSAARPTAMATSGLFQDLFAQISQAAPATRARAAATYTVRQGDTLSGICTDTLKRQGLNPSGTTVFDAVQKVAAANGIANPNVIRVGQALDLSAVASPAGRGGGRAGLYEHGAAATSLRSQASEELTKLVTSFLASPGGAKQAASSGNGWDRMLDQPAQLTSGFGARSDPITGLPDYHNGIDLAADPGAGVHPFASGTVVFSGWQAAYGKIVVVRHADGTETAYAHNAQNLVRQGQTVTERTTIAHVGSTGRSTGPHLHFEVRKGGHPVNPMPLLEQTSFKVAKAL